MCGRVSVPAQGDWETPTASRRASSLTAPTCGAEVSQPALLLTSNHDYCSAAEPQTWSAAEGDACHQAEGGCNLVPTPMQLLELRYKIATSGFSLMACGLAAGADRLRGSAGSGSGVAGGSDGRLAGSADTLRSDTLSGSDPRSDTASEEVISRGGYRSADTGAATESPALRRDDAAIGASSGHSAIDMASGGDAALDATRGGVGGRGSATSSGIGAGRADLLREGSKDRIDSTGAMGGGLDNRASRLDSRERLDRDERILPQGGTGGGGAEAPLDRSEVGRASGGADEPQSLAAARAAGAGGALGQDALDDKATGRLAIARALLSSYWLPLLCWLAKLMPSCFSRRQAF